MAKTPAEIGRNKFDEWCWKRGLELKPLDAELGCSTETVRRIRLPFSDPGRRVPCDELMARIVEYTGREIGPADFYPPHLRGAGAPDPGLSAEKA
jgi:hypothetical protein